MDRTEYLNGTGWCFHYDDLCFPPGTDSFLLSSLPRLKAGMQVLDLGCGSGLLGLLLLRRCPQIFVTGIELDAHAAQLGARNATENRLSEQLIFLQGDLRESTAIPAGKFDLVVCNPPYFPSGHGASAPNAARRGAREELNCTLEDVCSAAAKALHWSGSFCLVHKPDRLTDLLCTMRAARLEPKRLRFVQKTAESQPSLLLVEGKLGGKPGLILEAPLILHQSDGTPTAENDAIYYRTTPTTEETI
ncbi:MAG: methyltransferase domain-containing protein [Ruminococcaceae bacterium]|nr:methyltransferase domain-containing protein [Oscillospiraceae bacterium]